jgi:hypothetical protein
VGEGRPIYAVVEEEQRSPDGLVKPGAGLTPTHNQFAIGLLSRPIAMRVRAGDSDGMADGGEMAERFGGALFVRRYRLMTFIGARLAHCAKIGFSANRWKLRGKSMKRVTLVLAVILPALQSSELLAQSSSRPAIVSPAEPNSNQIEIVYLEPAKPEQRSIYERLKGRQMLEELRGSFAIFKLPSKLTLTFKGCDGQVNLWYSPSDRNVTVCYEYVDFLERLVPKQEVPDGPTRQAAILGGFVHGAFHGISHALFDILQIPILGGEEQAADQLAAFMILEFGRDSSRQLIIGAAELYKNLGPITSQDDFADEHGTSLQRFYNLLCLAYGADPEEFKQFAGKGGLPQRRAVRCGQEYQQVRLALILLFGPHLSKQFRDRR